MISLLDAPTDPSASRDIFLPFVATPPSAPIDPVAAFVTLLTSDPRQRRPRLVSCACLQQAAIWRAYGLAHGEPWSHIDRNGKTPNERIRAAGCRLPPDYALRGNHVEALVNGTSDYYTAFDALARSERHSVFLFAREANGTTNATFVQQWAFGAAMCEGGEAGWYWVLLMANCGE